MITVPDNRALLIEKHSYTSMLRIKTPILVIKYNSSYSEFHHVHSNSLVSCLAYTMSLHMFKIT
jgi:hypothetical protein